MKTIAHEAEPSEWIRHAVRTLAPANLQRLAPWALPPWTASCAPRQLQRFVDQRVTKTATPSYGFTAFELAGRLYSRGKRDRMFQSQFALRQLGSLWAARTKELADAGHIMAPSLAARRLFTKRPNVETTLLLDLPIFRTMHEDLELAAKRHPECSYLRRYRAPSWAIVEQESEIAIADHIIVRGRFAKEEVIRLGVSPSRVTVIETPCTSIRSRRVRTPGELRILLPGLAAARHGSAELLSVLVSRPWLRVFLRPGEGSEPAGLLSHPQVHTATAETLANVDAVVAPSLCEAYFEEVQVAVASGIPTISTERGAGAAPHDALTIELPSKPSNVERGLACALDALHGTESRPTAPTGPSALH